MAQGQRGDGLRTAQGRCRGGARTAQGGLSPEGSGFFFDSIAFFLQISTSSLVLPSFLNIDFFRAALIPSHFGSSHFGSGAARVCFGRRRGHGAGAGALERGGAPGSAKQAGAARAGTAGAGTTGAAGQARGAGGAEQKEGRRARVFHARSQVAGGAADVQQEQRLHQDPGGRESSASRSRHAVQLQRR